MKRLPTKLLAGKSHPLGASWDGMGVNFAVFSAHAQRIELCLFDSGGRREVLRLDLPECTDEVFHGYLPDAKPGLLYGYRAYGPYDPEAGHRFNPHKLLLDPYARKLHGQILWSDALYGYRVESARADMSFDRRDSAMAMPKAIVVEDEFQWGGDRPPDNEWLDTIIYETHVRGISMSCASIPEHERGSFAALGNLFIIDHLKKIGVTAVELLPIHGFLQDRFLVDKNLSNYWGYSTLSFFAPEQRYLKASEGSLNEVRMAIRNLHSAGIEVFLDVVYNHTCEGSEIGPTISWRGLDNLSYYVAEPDNLRRLVNHTGTGNTVNVKHPRVLQMVMDSLRHWVESYHVDGFRFDLGVTLGREASGFDPNSGFFDALRQDPVLSRVKLISEPWDIGPDGYHLGHHPPGIAEWNDRFRDCVRRFWRGDDGERPELAARLMGSSDIFEHRRRRPWASINYVASHDGFTLRDTTSFSERRNMANGEGGEDGHSSNFSANWGTEGEASDPAIEAKRGRIAQSMLTTLLCAHGTPMVLGGDEIGRTQRGNNNAYCQDNEISWYDWDRILDANDTVEKNLLEFLARLTSLRRSHPSLRSATFSHGIVDVAPGIKDVGWFDEFGEEISEQAWADQSARSLVLRRAVRQGEIADVTLLCLNASQCDGLFLYPLPNLIWTTKIDSANPNNVGPTNRDDGLLVKAHSAVLLGASIAL